jgi:hypothetical protein
LHIFSKRGRELGARGARNVYTLMPGCGELLLSALGFSPRAARAPLDDCRLTIKLKPEILISVSDIHVISGEQQWAPSGEKKTSPDSLFKGDFSCARVITFIGLYFEPRHTKLI